MSQENFDLQVQVANEKLDDIATGLTTAQEAIAAEGEQIRQFIEDNPAVNTSALDGVVARLSSASETVATLATGIGGVFEPTTEPTDPTDPTEPTE